MNVRNKIVALVMSFVICFCTVSNSFCDDKEYIIDNKNGRSALALGSLVLTKEAFNIIVGVAGACGVALLTFDDKVSFVDEFISYYKTTIKPDSGDFTTSPVEHFEEEIKKHVKRPSNNNSGGDNNNLIVGSSLVTLICSVFDNMFKDKPDKYYIYENSVPTADKYFSLKEQNLTLEHKEIVEVNLPGADSMQFKYNANMGDFYWKLNRFDNQEIFRGYRDTIFKRKCQPGCENYRKSGYYHLYVSNINYSSVIGNASVVSCYPNLNNGDYTNYIPCYYFEGQVDKTNYVPILKDTTVSNEDINDTNPNINVNGSLELPSGSVTPPGDSNVDFELPPLPSFDDEGIDLSFLTDLFEHLKGKFPFSIPFDLYNIIDVLRADPVAPVFDVNFLGNTLTLDLTQFDEWANIVRAFSVFSWVFVLFTFTKKLGG